MMDSKDGLTPFLKNAAEISPSTACDYLQTRDEECIISLPPINPQGGNLFHYFNPGKEGTYVLVNVYVRIRFVYYFTYYIYYTIDYL